MAVGDSRLEIRALFSWPLVRPQINPKAQKALDVGAQVLPVIFSSSVPFLKSLKLSGPYEILEK